MKTIVLKFLNSAQPRQGHAAIMVIDHNCDETLFPMCIRADSLYRQSIFHTQSPVWYSLGLSCLFLRRSGLFLALGGLLGVLLPFTAALALPTLGRSPEGKVVT